MSRYTIQNSSQSLVLPENNSTDKILNCEVGFDVRVSEYRRRVQTTERYGKPGGNVWGDRQSSSRDIEINYNISNPEPQPDINYEDTLNEILGIFNPELGPWYLVDTVNNRRADIELQRHQDEPEDDGLDRRVGVGTLDCLWPTGLWEAVDQTEVEGGTGGLTSGDTVSFENSGREFAWPVITITALDDIEEFTLRSIETGVFTRIGSNEFVAGSQMVISSVDGTIRLNDVEISRSLATGSGFIYLVAGENTIEYSSLGGQIRLDSLTFRPRWIR